MNQSNSLFLQQSYVDAWNDYESNLKKHDIINWDFVILTASNDEQAQGYRVQIEQRISKRLLPTRTHYAVLSDPDGKRIGSGGATLNVLKIYKGICGRRNL